jgi:inner membrane protein
MDPLTHTLVGANLAASRLGRTTRLAAPALIIGANLPDLDAILYFTGQEDLALGFRRGWTHGVLALVVLPLIQTTLLMLYARMRAAPASPPLRPVWLLALSFLAVLTHPALDWLNTYGMRWLMPFDSTWTYGDSVFIMDPWLWLILGAGWLAGRRPTPTLLITFVLITLAIGRMVARRSPDYLIVVGLVALVLLATLYFRPRREALLAATALFLGTGYISARLAIHEVTELQVQRQLGSVERLMVGPHPIDPSRWDVVAQVGDAYRYGWFDWRKRRLTLNPDRIPLPKESPEWTAARRDPSIRGFMTWVRFPWYELEQSATETRVLIHDARRQARRRPSGGFGGVVVTLPRMGSARPRGVGIRRGASIQATHGDSVKVALGVAARRLQQPDQRSLTYIEHGHSRRLPHGQMRHGHRVGPAQSDEGIPAVRRDRHNVGRLADERKLGQDLVSLRIHHHRVAGHAVDQPVLFPVRSESRTVRIVASSLDAMDRLMGADVRGVQDPHFLVAAHQIHVCGIRGEERAAIRLHLSRSVHFHQAKVPHVEHDHSSLVEARAEGDVAKSAVGGKREADRAARVLELALVAGEEWIIRQKELSPDGEPLIGQVDVHLDQLAVPRHIDRSDHRDQRRAASRRDRGVVGAGTRGQQSHQLPVGGANDGHVAGRWVGDKRVALIGGELDHVGNFGSLGTDVDRSDFLQRGVEDVDDVGPLIHGPDLVVGGFRLSLQVRGAARDRRRERDHQKYVEASAVEHHASCPVKEMRPVTSRADGESSTNRRRTTSARPRPSRSTVCPEGPNTIAGSVE